jgi:hypothetical protein
LGLTIPVEWAPKAPTFAADPPHTNGSTDPSLSEPAPAHA